MYVISMYFALKYFFMYYHAEKLQDASQGIHFLVLKLKLKFIKKA